MSNDELELGGPFEMAEEFEAGWPRSRSPAGPAPGRHGPPPGRQRRPRRVIRPLYAGVSQAREGHGRCEVLLVLEGYAPASPRLEAHHEPMLERLAADLRRMGTAAGRIEVVAVAPSTRVQSDGDLGDRRTDEVAARLKELLDGSSRMAFRRLARRGKGPARVEIRICRDEPNRRTR